MFWVQHYSIKLNISSMANVTFISHFNRSFISLMMLFWRVKFITFRTAPFIQPYRLDCLPEQPSTSSCSTTLNSYSMSSVESFIPKLLPHCHKPGNRSSEPLFAKYTHSPPAQPQKARPVVRFCIRSIASNFEVILQTLLTHPIDGCDGKRRVMAKGDVLK